MGMLKYETARYRAISISSREATEDGKVQAGSEDTESYQYCGLCSDSTFHLPFIGKGEQIASELVKADIVGGGCHSRRGKDWCRRR